MHIISSNFIVTFICYLFFCLIVSCTSNSANVTEYHQTIHSEVQTIKDDYLRLSELLSSRDKPAIKFQINQLNRMVSSSVKRLHAIPTLPNDFNYKALAIKQLEVLEENLKTRYPQIVKLIGVSNPTDNEVEQLERIYEEIENLEEPLFEQFEKANALFCNQHQIKNTVPSN